MEYELKESRKKITALQIDLQMCERTQKDFVQLSQSLQQELEKIRESDNQVSSTSIYSLMEYEDANFFFLKN